jgi:hypothetical protein
MRATVHGGFHPARHRDCAHMTTFTKQVNDGPVICIFPNAALLDFLEVAGFP